MAVRLLVTNSCIKKKKRHRAFILCQTQFTEAETLPVDSSQSSGGARRPQSFGTRIPISRSLAQFLLEAPQRPSFGIFPMRTWSSPSFSPPPPSYECKTLSPSGTPGRTAPPPDSLSAVSSACSHQARRVCWRLLLGGYPRRHHLGRGFVF